MTSDDKTDLRTTSETLSQNRVEAEAMPSVGDWLDNFYLERELGEGAFGKVFSANDKNTGRSVALKVIRVNRLSTNSRLCLENEARKAAAIVHESAATVYQAKFVDGGVSYLVMELINGSDLSSIINTEGPLPVDVAAKIAFDVGSALQVAHKQGVFHLDIKPANIIIRNNGRAVLTDFGLAIHDSERAETGIRGTLAYFSPEQVTGDGSHYDGRTDLWALGAVLYEMVSKKRPFIATPGENGRSHLIREICNVSIKPPSQWNPSVPTEIDEICARCLEKRKEDRYASASRFLDAIEPLTVRGRIKESHDNVATLGRSEVLAKGCITLAAIAAALITVCFGIARPAQVIDMIKNVLRAW